MIEQIKQQIEREPKLKGALIGVSLRSGNTGELLYEHMGDVRLRPASNMKLLSGAAALSILGEDHRFATEVLSDGEVNDTTLEGNLYLKGKGDPTLLPGDFHTFASKLKESGVTVVNGDIIGDDTWYDDVRLSHDLNWSDEHWYYGAQVSALTASPNTDYDSGSVIVEVCSGGLVDKQPIVTVTPETDYEQVINHAKIVATNEEQTITINREHGTNKIIIDGTSPVDSENVKEFIAVWEPTGYALDLLRQALFRNGITWTGKIRTGQAPEHASTILTHNSISLAELFVPFMKLSNNGHAEAMVKEMGRKVKGEGSWEKGLEVVEEALTQLGMDTDTLLLRDGSGISHVNLLPANEISKLLYRVQDEEWFPAFLNSLPGAGDEDRMVGGTLRNRMKGLSVQAKTGTIFSCSTVSGYVTTNSGERIIFSILINNLLDEEDGPAIQDRLVEIIANHY